MSLLTDRAPLGLCDSADLHQGCAVDISEAKAGCYDTNNKISEGRFIHLAQSISQRIQTV